MNEVIERPAIELNAGKSKIMVENIKEPNSNSRTK